jgi:AraC family transcriptional regulator
MSKGDAGVDLFGRNQELTSRPTPSGERSSNKYGVAGLLASSATRGWSNLTAELRSHRGTVAWNNPQPDAEICVDVRGSRSVVTRRLDGAIDSTISERGTIWFRPAGVQQGLIDMSEPVPAILHLYLPTGLFLSHDLGEGFDATAIDSLRHKGGFRDPLLA